MRARRVVSMPAISAAMEALTSATGGAGVTYAALPSIDAFSAVAKAASAEVFISLGANLTTPPSLTGGVEGSTT